MSITKRRTTKKSPKRRVAKKTTRRTVKKSPASKEVGALFAYMKKMASQRCPNGHKRKVIRRKLCVKPNKVASIKKLLRGRGIRGPMVVLSTGRGNKCINYVASGCKH